ncbi:hypothetical protein [Micromonospora sagamiensis]|uniref:DUF4177 domain-containing protein n=2 Tax=Micromonospora TaxID=1873 RepID=A0A1C6RAU8_9ACTN|nr:hypothetical protein [Micromonospora sagamiensis]TWJ26973.1 hypothetical protein JD81_00455 [Micromonospora sagamiensis]BCL14137.1 hypothetical protein GCM10017556_18760 [Micromonospora sagamiensis]SCL14231.1 hypothetical protein GA0074694_0675 [Micromonospora inyonensis]
MLRWEYALLVRRRQAASDDIGWEITFHWYGPDGTLVDVTPYGDTALAHLNRAGDQGWELVAMSEDPSLPGNHELHRYHLKRPKAPLAPRQRVRGAGRSGRRGISG